MDYSDDTEGKLSVFCLSLLEEEEWFHRLISVIVETWKYFKTSQYPPAYYFPSDSTSELGLVICAYYGNIPHGAIFRSNHLQRGVSRAGPTSALPKEYGSLEVENIKLQKQGELHFWTHLSTWNVIHFMQKNIHSVPFSETNVSGLLVWVPREKTFSMPGIWG